MRKKGWILLLVLLGVAFLMSCGKDTEPDETKGELVRIEREGCQSGILLFFELKKQAISVQIIEMIFETGSQVFFKHAVML